LEGFDIGFAIGFERRIAAGATETVTYYHSFGEVPEPSTYMMLAGGLAALALARRRMMKA